MLGVSGVTNRESEEASRYILANCVYRSERELTDRWTLGYSVSCYFGAISLGTFFVQPGKCISFAEDIFNRSSVFCISADFYVFVGKRCAHCRRTNCDKYNRNRYKSISLFKRHLYSFCILWTYIHYVIYKFYIKLFEYFWQFKILVFFDFSYDRFVYLSKIM